MTIYRADPPDLKEMEVDVSKKSGKDIGMGFAECTDNGIYVTEIVSTECCRRFSVLIIKL